MTKEAGFLDPSAALRPDNDIMTGAGPRERRLAPLFPQDLGEQVVGSEHEFPIPGLVNISTNAASLIATLEGAASLSVPAVPELLAPMQRSGLAVKYAPTRAGEHRAHVVVHAKWNDGHEESQVAPVTAKARSMDAAPLAEAKPETAAVATPPARVDKHAPALAVVTQELDKVRGAVMALILERMTGVDVVEKEQSKFKTPPAEPSLWADLVEMAIAMATDGIGVAVEHAVLGAVEKLGPRVLRTVVHHAADATAHAAEHAGERLSAKVIAGSVTGGIKQFVEHRLSGAAEHGETPHEGSAGAGAENKASTEADTYSADPTIDFFARQQHILHKAAREANNHVAEVEARLSPLAELNPDDATSVLEAITTALDASFEVAMSKQSQATATQFAAFKARLALGGEEVEVAGKPRTVTKMEAARQFDGLKAPGTIGGVLELRVNIGQGAPTVVEARIDGVAKAVTKRLLDISLAAQGVPVRIVLGNGYGVITRDEVGRVRYSGYLPLDRDSKEGMDEVQQLRGAERICSLVLSRSLRDWGLDAVETNDAQEESK